MHKTFCALSVLACLATTACIIEDTSDDDGASASNSASNSNSNGNSDSGTQGSNETSAAGDSTSAATSDATTTVADSTGGSGTGGSGMCGWGPLEGQMNVTDGYSCSGTAGEDPRNVFPRECPAEVALEAGEPCGGDMGVTGVGCCDGNTNWYCADSGSGPVLFSDPC